jgi:MoaA/NifB/PqqE/SkfB family radical SAM enzyme
LISLTKLLLDREHFGDRLRYHGGTPVSAGAAPGMGPVVVWNCTRACNLACRHCYASATPAGSGNELSSEEGRAFLESLAEFRVPAVLLSGGEPLMREDIFQLLEYGASLGLRMVLSTNGTLIGSDTARRLRTAGVSYAGISLDGLETVNDAFRGTAGAFKKTLAAFRHCRAAGQKAGLRLSLTRTTVRELSAIFRLVEEEGISRVCLYHLVSAGRGSELQGEDLTAEETRDALDFLIEKTLDFGARGVDTEILTVDNHCDGLYVFLKMRERDPERAERIFGLLGRSGGNRSGIAIGAVDWEGNVTIDQFTRSIILGNIREKGFSDSGRGEGDSVLAMVRDRKAHLGGRCGACRRQEQCNGNLRARALAAGDFWGPDPACYLTDGEIGL